LHPCLSCFHRYRLCVAGSSRNAGPYAHTNGDARSHSNAATNAYANANADGIAYRHGYPHAHAHSGNGANT